jgi:hypothetical protein
VAPRISANDTQHNGIQHNAIQRNDTKQVIEICSTECRNATAVFFTFSLIIEGTTVKMPLSKFTAKLWFH